MTASTAGALGAITKAAGELSGSAPGMGLPLQILVVMTLLTVIPSLLLMMTSFTRILVVLAVLRQALGLGQMPPNQLLVGISLFMTMFVMTPTWTALNQNALTPYSSGAISLEVAMDRGGTTLAKFMLAQTRKKDLQSFANIAGGAKFRSAADIPLRILVPAFVSSELRTAFEIGFLIYLPFLVIDLVVASVLMALGMMVLSPTIVSLPFKLLLFVMVDGWTLTLGSLARSFAAPGS